MRYAETARNRLRFLVILAAVTVLRLSLEAVEPSPGQAYSSFSTEITKLQTHKTNAEQWAKRLRVKLPPEHAAYKRCEVLYGDARAAFDGVISGLQTALITKKSPEGWGDFQASLDDAVAKSLVFQNFAEAVYFDQAAPVTPMAGTADVIAGVVKGLIEGAGTIFRIYWEAEESRRQQMRKDLDSVRWHLFQDV